MIWFERLGFEGGLGVAGWVLSSGEWGWGVFRMRRVGFGTDGIWVLEFAIVREVADLLQIELLRHVGRKGDRD